MKRAAADSRPGAPRDADRRADTVHAVILGLCLTAFILLLDGIRAFTDSANPLGIRSFESFLLEQRFRHAQLFTPPPAPDIVHVDIDDGAESRIAKWPWRRDMTALAIDTLHALGARTIALDVLFEEQEQNVGVELADGSFAGLYGDEALADSIARAGNVVLAARIAPREAGVAAPSEERLAPLRNRALAEPRGTADSATQEGVLVPPLMQCARGAKSIGLVNFDTELNRSGAFVVRAWDRAAGLVLPQFGIAAAAAHSGVPVEEIEWSDARVRVGDVVIPLRSGRMLFPWAMPARGNARLEPDWLRVHRHVSIGDVLQLGREQRAWRRTIAALLQSDEALLAPPSPRQVAEAKEQFDFLMADYQGVDLRARYAELQNSPDPSVAAEAAVIASLIAFEQLKDDMAPGGPHEKAFAAMRNLIEGKLVIVGWIASGAAADFVPTPLGAKTAGPVAHAAVANGILTGHVLRTAPPALDLLLTALLGVCSTLISVRLSPQRSWIVAGGLLAGFAAFNAVALFDAFNLVSALAGPSAAIALSWAGCTTFRAVRFRQERAAIMRQFRSRVSSQLADFLAEHPEQLNMEGEERELTIMFADFAGFTSIAEKLDGRRTVFVLNSYLRALAGVLLESGAYVNKFLGDGLMAFWGAPAPAPDHASRAVRAIPECYAAMERVAADPALEGVPRLGLRIGVATGRVIVGDCGAPPLLNDYTVIGDSVNLAARLEAANKQFGTDVLVTKRTWDLLEPAVRDALLWRPLGLVRVAGQSAASEILELVGRKTGGEEQIKLEEWIALNNEAINLYRAGQYQAAYEKFVELVIAERGSAGALLYVQQCNELIKEGRMDEALPLRQK